VVNVYSVLDEEPRDFNVAVKECSGKQFSSTKSAYLPDFAALRYADSRMIWSCDDSRISTPLEK